MRRLGRRAWARRLRLHLPLLAVSLPWAPRRLVALLLLLLACRLLLVHGW